MLASNPCEIETTNLIEHPITLMDDIPIYKRPYKITKAHEPLLEENINELLRAGVINESSSPYSSPCIIVFATNKKPRMVVDFRELNKKTIGDRYPFPNIDFVRNNGGCKLFLGHGFF